MLDANLARLSDIPAAAGLLTRWPVDANDAPARGAAAAWAYPLIGAAIALLLGVAAWLFLGLGVPVSVTAALILGIGMIVTGALHEDGLADSADGLWGASDRDRRLKIMRDSRIGTYGVLALSMGILIRWGALSVILTVGSYLPALIVTGMLSRSTMVAAMHYMPNARADGLSASVGRPSRSTMFLALGIALLGALLLTGLFALAIAVWASLAVYVFTRIARAKIGGQTGDILGAAQQIAETVILIVIAAQLA
ncbi:MAG: adenosylcobinamide-GDP ribazoletransferase [Pseudomonadota bacterium]